MQQDNASEERHYSGGDKSVMHSGIFGTMDMVGIHAHGVLADHGGGKGLDPFWGPNRPPVTLTEELQKSGKGGKKIHLAAKSGQNFRFFLTQKAIKIVIYRFYR